MSNLILENEHGERMELGFSFKEMIADAAQHKKAVAESFWLVRYMESRLMRGDSPAVIGEEVAAYLAEQPKALREQAERILGYNLVALHCMPSLAKHSQVLQVLELRVKVRKAQTFQSGDTSLNSGQPEQTGQSDSR